MKFNHRDATRARAMKRKGLSPDVILQFFKGQYTWDDIGNLIARLRKINAEYQTVHYGGYEHNVRAYIPPPPEVIEHQQRRIMLRAKTITALICGDPLPGESALDRRLAVA